MIELRGVSKSYGGVEALRDASLRVDAGEILVLLGANGAGKTTLLKCLAGIVRPQAGTISVAGLDRWRDHLAIRRFTAWMPDRPFAYGEFSGREWIRLQAEVYGVPGDRADRDVESLIALFRLGEVADRNLVHYSNGEFKKLALAATLATRARLLILDEPFAGEIDPAGAATARELLGSLAAQRGTTVVFSTQIVAQAERTADRIALLDRGQLLSVGRPEEILREYGGRDLEEVVRRIAGPGSESGLPDPGSWAAS